MRLSVRTSAMPSSGSSTTSCSMLTSSAAARSSLDRPAPGRAAYHFPSRYIAACPFRAGVDVEAVTATLLRDALEELRRRQAAEISDHAVVGKDLHLVVGKRDGEHAVVLARSAARQRPPRARRAGRAMMPVGNVERRQSPQSPATSASWSAAGTVQILWRTPSGAVKSKSGRSVVAARHDGVDRRGCGVGEKHRTGLRADREHVPRAIVFLVRPRLLVLLDEIVVVLVDRKAGGDAGLHMRSHLQLIHVEGRGVFFDERRPRPQVAEVFGGALVDGVGVWIALGR